MLVKEEQLTGHPSMILNRLNYLNEEEMKFPAVMVPVIHNSRTNYDLIQLESFLKFGQENNIDDGGYAIAKICEANEVPTNRIGFVVNEENVYENEELYETFTQLLECNFPIFVAPISKDSIYSTKLNDALIMDEAYDRLDECENLINYCIMPINEVGLADTKKAISKKLAAIQKQISQKTAQMKKASGDTKVFLGRELDKLHGMANNLKSKLVDAKDGIVSGVKDKVSSIRNTLQDKLS